MMNPAAFKGTHLLACLTSCLVSGPAPSADSHVQQQLQVRDQQELELRLRMQQQSERATLTSSVRAPGARRQGLEIEQQQRLRQSHEQALRARIAADALPHSSTEPARTSQRDSAELDRLSVQRRLQTEPADRSAKP